MLVVPTIGVVDPVLMEKPRQRDLSHRGPLLLGQFLHALVQLLAHVQKLCKGGTGPIRIEVLFCSETGCRDGLPSRRACRPRSKPNLASPPLPPRGAAVSALRSRLARGLPPSPDQVQPTGPSSADCRSGAVRSVPRPTPSTAEQSSRGVTFLLRRLCCCCAEPVRAKAPPRWPESSI